MKTMSGGSLAPAAVSEISPRARPQALRLARPLVNVEHL
ncbi:hypothetical protein USDA257_c19020 [Sinorhizobium fredii USDA 257]|uniref:Uncharacterized protein n=1 Tax=Sinorhizobium fredii (strain USDA 257) TaxID=1185652 RepID=I3X3N3_SINF2|nr:hypothetical protein USDA257_c19020 [Sinorhizobium fredii USDA 257]